MKIREIINEEDLEKSLDSYFKKRELEKKRAELRSQPKAKPQPVAEPTGDDPYSRTLGKVNAPKDRQNWKSFKGGFSQSRELAKDAALAIGRGISKATSHKLFQPK